METPEFPIMEQRLHDGRAMVRKVLGREPIAKVQVTTAVMAHASQWCILRAKLFGTSLASEIEVRLHFAKS